MAFYITGSEAGDAALAYQELINEATTVTRLLCKTMEFMDEDYEELLPSYFPTDVASWWKKHKNIDKKRKEKEQKQQAKLELAQRAKKKLSKEELEALGVR